MENVKKQILVKHYIIRSLVLSSAFFIALIAWQGLIFYYNKNNTTRFPAWLFAILLVALAIWFFCYFEIRTITKNDERFLGFKCYILFFIKLFYIPIVVLSAIGLSKITDSVIYCITANFAATLIYYVPFCIFLFPYRTYVKNNTGEIYICYQMRVKKWYFENSVL